LCVDAVANDERQPVVRYVSRTEMLESEPLRLSRAAIYVAEGEI
jgi:hypothetical protein